jgi:putative ABC transport system permease protein
MNPPRLARALLVRAVPADRAGLSIVGDLDHEFAERRSRDGRTAARFWYWRQAWSIWWWSAWAHPHTSHHSPRGDVMSDLIGDLRHAFRVARTTPGQTMLIVCTLALGIGVSTIGFAFADTAFVRGLPVADPTRTVIGFGLDARDPDRRGGVYAADFLDLRERTRTVEALSSWEQSRATVMWPGSDPTRSVVSYVVGDLFSVWGVRAQLGRTLLGNDSVAGAPRVAVLTDRYWRETAGADRAVLGREIVVNGESVTVVGVLARDIEIGTFANIAMWISQPAVRAEPRDTQPVMMTGRLAPGVTVEQAAAEFRVLAKALEAEHPQTNRGRQVQVLSARRAIGGPNFALVLSLLVGAAVLVVVIASVNVAGVLLARAVKRQQEFAVRIALGARHARLFRQLAVEGLLLAVAGGAGGVLVAEAGLRVIRSVDAEPIFQQIVIDWHELVFIGSLALLAPVFFSLAPALASIRLNVLTVMNATSARVAGRHSRRAREVLVAAQLALAIALAVVGGLVARTAAAMVWAPTGFETADRLTLTLALDEHSPDPHVRRQALREFVRSIADGGKSAAALDALPAVIIEAARVVQPDGQVADDPSRAWAAYVVRVDAPALDTLGVPLLAGRPLSAADVDNDTKVALVSREAAERFFGGAATAVGRRLDVVESSGAAIVFQVVGVTGDVRDTDPEDGPPARVWLPLSHPTVVSFVVSTAGDTAGTAALARTAARAIVPGVPLETVEAYEQGIARQMGGNQIAMGMLLAFVFVGLVFSGTGLYGTVALATNLRHAEFATRLALGATPRDVIGLVARQTMRLVLIGLVPGLVAGLALANAIRGLLYGVTPLDPLNIVTLLVVLSFVALVAGIGPALRAGRVNVIDAIRSQ